MATNKPPHAITRAKTRYRMRLSSQDLQAISATIRSGGSLASQPIDKIYSRHVVEVGDKEVPVVFNRLSGDIVTVLPKKALKRIWRAWNQLLNG
jgi:hypothetical protein